MANDRFTAARWLGAGALLGLGLLLVTYLPNWRHPSLVVLAGTMVSLSFLNRTIPFIDFIHKRADDAVQGAEAEEAVGRILDRLPSNYIVRHDVPCAMGNIDHVVFRKDGAVFIIETKSQRGKVTDKDGELLIGGRRPKKDFLKQTIRQSLWLKEHLKNHLGFEPWVHAGLVFTNAWVACRGPVGMGKVTPLNAKYLQQWLAQQPENPRLAGRLSKILMKLEVS